MTAALAAAILVAFITPFQRDLFVGDETKYGAVVREMRATGHVFLPTLLGQPFTHKPPLHFWLIDLFTVPLGVNSTWAFVLPSLIALLFLIWLMWRMGGPMAAFVCATSLMIWGSAQSARMDISFTAFIVLAVWMMQRERLFAAGVSLGIATLIKGPMAPVIGIVLYLLEWWRRRERPRGNVAAGFAAMALIPLAWFVPAMLLGGRAYTHDVIMKQTVGRAVATWVHQAPPWFYLLHLPGSLFPWFFVALAALRGANRFYINWILAVIVPYSLMSSKLDVYMMAMIPPVALMIADVCGPASAGVEGAGRAPTLWATRLTIVLFIVPIFLLGLVPPQAKVLIVILAAAALGSLFTWKSPLFSTIAVGIVPLVPLVYAALTMMPFVNDIGSTQRLIAAIERQHVPPESVALYACPYLWARDMPAELTRVRYANANNIDQPAVLAVMRSHAGEIEPALRGYHRVEEVQMIGKWFDVYRR
ncbi:MAG TPA: glycosyltransferase family 39 protein [Thermoanaerobaculia bacterium]|nr:glycosyltransferase family 39 protein [Thermoanaerobaculia bacterium]